MQGEVGVLCRGGLPGGVGVPHRGGVQGEVGVPCRGGVQGQVGCVERWRSWDTGRELPEPAML